ncbi:MAG: hypothetical protein U0936_13005 [Planctomycetaceae bacterium]
MKSNEKVAAVAQPTFEERAAVAEQCRRKTQALDSFACLHQ